VTDVIEGFDIATDLKVEFYLPDAEGNLFILGVSLLNSDDVLAGANQFIIGVSELGGTDLLAGGSEIGFLWTPLECNVSKLITNIGGDVQNSLYFQPRPGQATITMQDLIHDPTSNPSFRAGVPVRVRIDNGVVDYTIFSGYMDQINVAYDKEGNNLLTITAFDDYKRLVSSRLAILDTLDPIDFPDGYATPYQVIELIAEQFGTVLDDRSEQTIGKIPGVTVENFIPNAFVYEAIKNGLAIFWVDPASSKFVFIPRPTSTGDGDIYTIGNNHDAANHLCMSDIKVSGDLTSVYNSLYVSLEDNPATNVLVKSPDSIELYGEIAFDETLNTTDIDELELWASSVYSQTTTKLVNSVQTPALDRLGNLTHAAEIEPGEVVNITYQTDELNINDDYTVSKVSHNIDVNNWFTTLELWKGY
jgi:hypothetical protein